jgi:hypothetical protein
MQWISVVLGEDCVATTTSILFIETQKFKTDWIGLDSDLIVVAGHKATYHSGMVKILMQKPLNCVEAYDNE